MTDIIGILFEVFSTYQALLRDNSANTSDPRLCPNHMLSDRPPDYCSPDYSIRCPLLPGRGSDLKTHTGWMMLVMGAPSRRVFALVGWHGGRRLCGGYTNTAYATLHVLVGPYRLLGGTATVSSLHDCHLDYLVLLLH
jgi:hypothetical protein